MIQAAYQICVLLVLNYHGESILQLSNETKEHAVDIKNTMVFNTFVLGQIFNEFNARKPDEMNVFSGVTKNYLFIGIVAVTIVLQVIIVEFLGKFAKTVPLTWNLWLIAVGIGIVSWPLAVLGKLIPVPKTPLSKFLRKPFTRRRNNA